MRPVDKARKKQLNQELLERKGGRMQNDKRRLLTKVFEREAQDATSTLSPYGSRRQRSFYDLDD